jgi:DNA polymerase III subunit gamma/tau
VPLELVLDEALVNSVRSGRKQPQQARSGSDTSSTILNMCDRSVTQKNSAYRVLARKYRPRKFEELVGQETLIQILTNAIQSNRIAHAFMLSGVRGIGKTTTARLIALGLNCVDGPTITPCGTCEICTRIIADNHMDVLEIDAASRTGIDDIRELIDGIKYKPVSARYKIYIIDEVHMLSKNAFNALLKTLEEPPAHAKFIFATTEIRRVPITILSRCQRFDLRMIDTETLAEHLIKVASQEAFTLPDAAAQLLARSAQGSVRDGLSLLDQALVYCGTDITSFAIQEMLGLTDRHHLYDFFVLLMGGKVSEALALSEELFQKGADPLHLMEDLLELTNFLSRGKVETAQFNNKSYTDCDRERGKQLAEQLSMPVLIRCWQMLLKGIEEVKQCPFPHQAFEMIAIRIGYMADLPTPDKIVKQLQAEHRPAAPPPKIEQIETVPQAKPAPQEKSIEDQIHEHPLVKKVMATFPGAKITHIEKNTESTKRSA